MEQQLAREVLDEAAKIIKPGVTGDEIDRVVHEVTQSRAVTIYVLCKLLQASIERDCYPSPLNYYKFPKSCCV